ncbi:putative membrane protein [Bradyrhizobium sp. USDA 377]
MTLYFLVKFLHVLGAIVILGTGTGIAFFMLMAHRTQDAEFIARTASVVVIADAIFTLSAVILQPVSGGVLMMLSATSIREGWMLASLALYAIAGLFWVPVIFMQIEMRDLARKAADQRTALPERYFVLFRRWFAFGFPGFGATMLILWLMVAKPF